MNALGYLEKAYMPARNGRTETVANFSLRVLTSRAPNLLPPGPFVLNKITNGAVVVMVAGEPEGNVLMFDAEQVGGPLHITVGSDQFAIKSTKPRHKYDGNIHRETIERAPDLEPMLLDHTTTILGEMGLYAGIDTSWWQTVQE